SIYCSFFQFYGDPRVLLCFPTRRSSDLPFVWVTPAWSDLPLLIGVGLMGGTAQLFMTRGYALAPASVAAPFDYTHLLWSVLFGWYIWGDFPDLQTWVGCAIVVASGLYILYRETVRRQPVPQVWTE